MKTISTIWSFLLMTTVFKLLLLLFTAHTEETCYCNRYAFKTQTALHRDVKIVLLLESIMFNRLDRSEGQTREIDCILFRMAVFLEPTV